MNFLHPSHLENEALLYSRMEPRWVNKDLSVFDVGLPPLLALMSPHCSQEPSPCCPASMTTNDLLGRNHHSVYGRNYY